MARLTRPETQPVYSAAQRFVERCLRQDDSLFTPGRAVWSLPVCQDLHARFVERPDTSKDSFENKFRQQLAGAPPATIQLAAELLFVHLLAARQVLFDTKRSLIQHVLGWSAQAVTLPEDLLPALRFGLASTGMAFLTYRHQQLALLLEFTMAWKRLTSEERERLLAAPWAFKEFLFALQVPAAQPQQNALLHIVHPDTFEPTLSQNQKRSIADAFVGQLSQAPEDLDRQLFEIRRTLEAQHGGGFSFYDDALLSQWDHQKPSPPSPPEAPPTPPTARRYWVEKSLVSGRPDRESGDNALGRALWSPQRSKDGRDYYRSMREIVPGDVVLHFVDNAHFAGVSRVASAPDDTFIGLAGTDWAGRPAIRAQLTDYVELSPPLRRDLLLQNPAVRARVESVLNQGKNLFFNRDYQLNQGAYLTEAPMPLVQLVDELYRAEAGRGLPYVDAPGVGDPAQPPSSTVPTMDWLVDETLWRPEDLETIIDTIRSRSPQIVLAGPPGTSKTWVAKRLAHFLTQGRPGAVRLVQFHPSYAYEEFIEGLRPVAQAGAIQFQRVDGVVLRMVKDLAGHQELGVLVIDEMNRANLPRVLGELMHALEYRDQPIDLQYSRDFCLPRNLLLIGTMNTADRSIRSLDIALRRRFDVFECPPDPAILERYYEAHENRVEDLLDGFQKLNEELTQRLDRHHTIGHTFFMENPMTPDRLRAIWRHKIGPLVEEYFFDQPDVARAFAPEVFWKTL